MKRTGRRVKAAVAVAAVVAAAGVISGGAVGTPPIHAEEVAASPGARGQHRWVTLVTGDRVLLRLAGGAEHVVTVRPGKGREGVKFQRLTERGDTLVVPADVAPLVAAKRVDRRLFNVSKLVEFGYDDGRRKDVPLIVTYDGTAATAAGTRLRGAGAQVKRALPSVRGDAVAVPKGTTAGFWKSVRGGQVHTLTTGLTRVWLDGRAYASLDRSVPQIGAPTAWQAGHTGKGAKVAVLDTGVDATHPDLVDAVTAAKDFTGSPSGTADRFGHGTHVAGIITGSGAASGGKYKGVAPDATILNGKVLDDSGGGEESWIIAGMQWAVAQGADVVNMSLGGGATDGTDPLSQAVNQLTRDSGVLFVIAAGNAGPSDNTIGTPGAADEALTVGAVDKGDQLASFSSRGPRIGDHAIKPDITAPGVDIVAPLADGSVIGGSEPVIDGQYVSLSGTSMATPHVTGAAAILAAQHPQWTAERLKPALTGTAVPRDGLTVFQQGAGRVDVARATAQQVTTVPASVSLGKQTWPHDDDEPVSTTMTYRNDGTTPVTLDLAVDVRDPAGEPAPAGMFTLDKQQLTVPAGGTASATIVSDTSVSAPDGVYSGAVTATAGQARVRTPVGVEREAESYDVSFTLLDRDGNLTPSYMLLLASIERRVEPFGSFFVHDPSGKVVVRLPKGRYFVAGDVNAPDPDEPMGSITSAFSEPGLTVAGDLDLVFDAREAKPVSVTVDQPGARVGSGRLGFVRRTSWGGTGMEWILNDFDGMSVIPSRTAAPAGDFTTSVRGELAEGDGGGSPYLYNVGRDFDSRVPGDLALRFADRDLAKVTARIAATRPDQVVSKDFVATVTAPATITEYYSPGLQWNPLVMVHRPGQEWDFDSYVAATVNYREPGGNHVVRWNVGVFGPALADDGTGVPAVSRQGDAIQVSLGLFGDQAPNHTGVVLGGSTQLVLHRNGEKVGEASAPAGRFDVPSDEATYRLTADATHDVWPLSTRVSTAWTFRSGTTDGVRNLPLMVVRYAPPLDDHNRAKAGLPFAFPVYVQRQAGAEYGSLTELTVRVSYDDGKTWQPVRLAGSGMNRVAVVNHPAGDGFVSLRATAVDSNGNKVEQTITRAYAIHA